MRTRMTAVAAVAGALAGGCMGVGHKSLRAEPGAAEAMALRAAETPAAESVQRTRQLIWTAALTLEVADVAGPAQQAADLVKEAGGYVQNRSDSKENHASLTLRVPAAGLKDLMTRLETLGKVKNRHLASTDVTEQAIDLEARLKNMIALRDRLQQLLEKATDVKDVLAIETELSRAQAQVDSLTGRLNALRGQVDLATLELTLRRKRILGPLGATLKGLWWGLEKLFVIRE